MIFTNPPQRFPGCSIIDGPQCVSNIPNSFFIFYHTDEYAYLICQFGVHRILTHIGLTIAEMVIFKILYLHKFSIIASMDEYFFTNFVTLINFMINFGLTIIKFSLGEHRRSNTYLYIFAKPTEVHNTIPWPGP